MSELSQDLGCFDCVFANETLAVKRVLRSHVSRLYKWGSHVLYSSLGYTDPAEICWP